MADTGTGGIGCGCKYCRATGPLITDYFTFEGSSYEANLPLENYDENMFIETEEGNLKINLNDYKVELIKVEKGTLIEDTKMYGTEIKSIFFHCIDIVESKIKDAKILAAHLSESTLQNVDLIDSDFNYATLQCADLISSEISNSCFEDSDLSSSSIRKSQISKTNFSKADFQDSEVTSTHISECDFSESDFTDAEFDLVTFKNCKLNRANMGAGSLRESASFNNSRFIDCDLSEVNVAVIGVDRIDLSEETTIGKKLPESVSDYKQLEEAYKRIEARSRQKGISRLRREAKILKKKSKRKRDKLE